MNRVIVYFLALLFNLHVKAQDKREYPIIGDTLQRYAFYDLAGYSKSSVSLDELRGKWLILDFWATTCSGCLNSFPKMSKLSEQFKDRANLIMIGAYVGKKNSPSSEERTKRMYEVFKSKQNLKFPVAFDSTLYRKLKVGSLPHILVIDPNGVLVAKTYFLDSLTLASLIDRREIAVKYSYSLGETKQFGLSYKRGLPILTNGVKSNGGIDTSFIARSLLTKWTENMLPYDHFGFNTKVYSFSKSGWAEVSGLDVMAMLRVAFTGQTSWSPGDRSNLYGNFSKKIILTDVDSALFRPKDELTGENMYCYSLRVPDYQSSPETLRRIFQQDLQRYFGFSAKVERRSMPTWRLVVINRKLVEKIRTKGGDSHYVALDSYEGNTFKNISVDQLVKTPDIFVNPLYPIYLDYNEIPPVYNDTGLDFNIDISLHAFTKDIEEVRTALRKNGLDLIPGTKEISVIVVSKAVN